LFSLSKASEAAKASELTLASNNSKLDFIFHGTNSRIDIDMAMEM
jgi:hypothetical protein